jgi:hypothetical protein
MAVRHAQFKTRCELDTVRVHTYTVTEYATNPDAAGRVNVEREHHGRERGLVRTGWKQLETAYVKHGEDRRSRYEKGAGRKQLESANVKRDRLSR